MAMLAGKHRIAEAVPSGITHLTPATRPIGVWTAHLPELKEKPELALPLLDPLHADPARYVRNAVVNWLIDASKSRPDWVRATCARWQQQSDGKAAAYVVKRRLRTIDK